VANAAWACACHDEFNRGYWETRNRSLVSLEEYLRGCLSLTVPTLQVLSVVAQQVLDIQRAIGARVAKFSFEGTELALKRSAWCASTCNKRLHTCYLCAIARHHSSDPPSDLLQCDLCIIVPLHVVLLAMGFCGMTLALNTRCMLAAPDKSRVNPAERTIALLDSLAPCHTCRCASIRMLDFAGHMMMIRQHRPVAAADSPCHKV
jgi:Hydrolytic ATP binding site of dynein motor region